MKLALPALLSMAVALPLLGQATPDTVRTHPGDTLRIVVPDTGRFQVDVTRRMSHYTLTRHIWVISQANTTTPPPIIPIPPVGGTDPGGGTPPADNFVTPDLISNASFENGWEDFKSSSFSDPSGATRDSSRSYAGRIGVHRVLPNTMNTTDQGGGLDYQFYAGPPWGPANVPAQTFDRLWTRFYFYLDAPISGPFKFHQLYSASYGTQFSGLYLYGGNLGVLFTPEAAGGGIVQPIIPLAQLVGDWHYIEMDYWRNGDPSGFPSVALWLDGEPITEFMTTPTAPLRWDSNGRIQLGARASSDKIGLAHWLGVLNGKNTGGLGNSVAGNIWIDRISISSKGRIGP